MALAAISALLALAPALEPANNDDMLQSMRAALRSKDEQLRTMRRSSDNSAFSPDPQSAAGVPLREPQMRRLQAATPAVGPELCSSGDCRVELTTGLAEWSGARPTRSDPHWAPVYRGQWIGESNPDTARSLLVASVSFRVAEPACASFDLAFAADGRVRSAQLNGRALFVPPHGHRTTTAQLGATGLIAARGAGLFFTGMNSLVLTVANDAGALGLYVAGSVQLLCPLDEASISMRPALGPSTGGTLLELTSNVMLYAERWIRCSFGELSVDGTVYTDGKTVRCVSPNIPRPLLRGWVDVQLVTSHQGLAAVGVNYKGTRPRSSSLSLVSFFILAGPAEPRPALLRALRARLRDRRRD